MGSNSFGGLKSASSYQALPQLTNYLTGLSFRRYCCEKVERLVVRNGWSGINVE